MKYRSFFLADDVVRYSEFDKLETLDDLNDEVVYACIKYNNIEFLQRYISKFNNGTNIIVPKYMIHQLFDYERTDMINLLMKFFEIVYDLDNVKDLDEFRTKLEYCHRNNFEYMYTHNLPDNLSRLGVLEDSEEIFAKYNLEYKFSKNGVDNAAYESIKWLYKKYKLGNLNFEYSCNAIQNAIYKNSVELLKWWIYHSDEFELKYDDLSFHYTGLEVIKFLLYEQDIIKSNITFEKICKNYINNSYTTHDFAKLDLLYDSLIKNDCPLQINNPFISSVEILNWLYDKFKLGQIDLIYTKNNFINNIGNNCIDCIKWWADHSDEFNFDHIVIDENDYYENHYDENDLSIIYGDDDDYYNKLFIGECYLTTVKYIFFEQKIIKMIPYSRIIDRLFQCNTSESIKVIDLFYENKDSNELGFDYTSNAIDYCQRSEKLKWWLDHIDDLELKYTSKSIDQILHGYYNNDNYLGMQLHECLRFWCDNRFVIQPKFTRDLLVKYLNEDSNENSNDDENDDLDKEYLRVLLD